jgi:hypothetical protein
VEHIPSQRYTESEGYRVRGIQGQYGVRGIQSQRYTESEGYRVGDIQSKRDTESEGYKVKGILLIVI